MINITSRLSKSSNNKTKKVCPAGTILNPNPKRCVNVNGAIGQKLVLNQVKSPGGRIWSDKQLF